MIVPIKIGVVLSEQSINLVLSDIIQTLNTTIKEASFISEQKDGEASFSGDRVFTFGVLVSFLMTNLQKGLQRGIALFAEAIQSEGGSIPEVSKAAFCKVRKRLKPTAFSKLSKIACQKFYDSGEVRLWNGYRIIGVDGSTAELPSSKEIQGPYGVLLARIELESDETEILLSSLVDEQKITHSQLKKVYGLRWPVEESYKTFKHKVCIENFSGKSQKAVLQDFYVKIFIMNLTTVAVRPINEALKKESVKVKYVHQVNFIEAIATMKKAVVSFFVTGKVTEAIKRIVRRLSVITEPIRPGRKFKRNHQPKRKHYMNYKQV